MRRYTVFSVSLLILIIVSAFAGYEFLRVTFAIDAARAKELQEASTAAEQRQSLLASFSSLHNVTQKNLLDGFWYTYRDESGSDAVMFFSLADLVARGLSEAQIARLTGIIASSTIIDATAMRRVPEEKLPPKLQFHNEMYAVRDDGSYLAMQSDLEKKLASKQYTSDDLFELSYVNEFEGNYAERDRLDALNCKQFKQRCASSNGVTLKGKVLDLQGNPVQGATVEAVSRPGTKTAITDVSGGYTLAVPIADMEKVRIKATKRNYSDGVASVIALNANKKVYAVEDIIVSSPIDIVTIDSAHNTVTGEGNQVTARSFVIHTPNSTYEIPKDAIVHKDGTPYHGVVDVYLYEFTQDTIPAGLTNVDTFDQVRGYAGNLMKTFGMPYIQFFSPDKEELHVRKSNPMVLTYKIYNMQELRDNKLKIYGPLTDADMITLVNASAGGGYPIDRQFLIDHQLLRFPAFWVFDQITGVWQNIGVNVIDTSGIIRSLFYTLNDDHH